ncbi:hypothetical protein MRX96_040660 [Rhipicephalus microplus]
MIHVPSAARLLQRIATIRTISMCERAAQARLRDFSASNFFIFLATTARPSSITTRLQRGTTTTLSGIDGEEDEVAAVARSVCVGICEEETNIFLSSSSSSQDARPLLSQGWASPVPQATSGFQRESQPPLLLPDGRLLLYTLRRL